MAGEAVVFFVCPDSVTTSLSDTKRSKIDLAVVNQAYASHEFASQPCKTLGYTADSYCINVCEGRRCE